VLGAKPGPGLGSGSGLKLALAAKRVGAVGREPGRMRVSGSGSALAVGPTAKRCERRTLARACWRRGFSTISSEDAFTVHGRLRGGVVDGVCMETVTEVKGTGRGAKIGVYDLDFGSRVR